MLTYATYIRTIFTDVHINSLSFGPGVISWWISSLLFINWMIFYWGESWGRVICPTSDDRVRLRKAWFWCMFTVDHESITTFTSSTSWSADGYGVSNFYLWEGIHILFRKVWGFSSRVVFWTGVLNSSAVNHFVLWFHRKGECFIAWPSLERKRSASEMCRCFYHWTGTIPGGAQKVVFLLSEIWNDVKNFGYPGLLDEKEHSLVQAMKMKDEAPTVTRTNLFKTEVSLVLVNQALYSFL